MVLPILMGVAQGALGIASAFGQQQTAQAEVDARNRSLLNQYKERLKIAEFNQIKENNIYSLKLANYQDQLRENNLAAGRAYMSEQQRLNEVFKASRFNDQAMMIQQAQSMGSIQATGRSGQTIDRMRALQTAALGRNQAIQQTSLESAISNASMKNQRVRDQLRLSNRNAFRNVQFTPMTPPSPVAPTYQSAPSQIPLYSGIAKGVLGGIQTGYEMDNLINS